MQHLQTERQEHSGSRTSTCMGMASLRKCWEESYGEADDEAEDVTSPGLCGLRLQFCLLF